MPDVSFGWKPDPPDFRDRAYMLDRSMLAVEIPDYDIDLRPFFPEAYDQGALGSCTAWAAKSLAAHLHAATERECPDLSALFLYYYTRVLEGTTDWDSGATLRNTMKAFSRYGTCKESEWPYNLRNFRALPHRQARASAKLKQALIYRRVERSRNTFLACLAANKPFVFGFTVYESFMSEEMDATGYMPMPSGNEKVLGAHAVVAVGSLHDEQRWICRNQWGKGWGHEGYFYMPWEYLLDSDLSDDFWCLDLIE